jgi:hypothetical protein
MEECIRVGQRHRGCLQNSDNPLDVQSFNDTVLKRCQYYHTLYDVMADRAGNEPKLLSYHYLDDNSNPPSIGTTTILDDDDDNDDVEEIIGIDGDDVAVLPANIPRKVTVVPKPPEKRRRGSAASNSTFFGSGAEERMKKLSRISTQKFDESARHNRVMEKLTKDTVRHNRAMEKLTEDRLLWEKDKYSK